MSNNVGGAVLTLNSKGVWKPAKGKDAVYHYSVQHAPTMRARCRKCSQFIQKGDIKIGIPIRHSHGEYGWITAWQHVGCTRISDRNDVTNIIYGFDELSSTEQTKVLEEVTSDIVPRHLIPLDPNDLVKRGPLHPVEPPTELLRPLLRYQLEGLGWMIEQERSEVRGGILADEMGMGKTIQMISLFLARRLLGPSLVICPVSSMLQWKTEITEHVVQGSLSVVVLDRIAHAKKEDMEVADVVLTTYPMLEQSWRLLVNKTKITCPYCGRFFLPRQLVVHNRYFCGPQAKKTLRQRKREHKESNMNIRKIQSKETVRKGLRTLHVDVDDNDDDDDDNLLANDNLKERGVVGPMGMYRDLMLEAGRRIRSRWEPAKEESISSNSSTGSDKEDYSSSEITGTDSEEHDDMESSKDENEALESFRCPHCEFQLLRYPFCPKTGQYHVLTESMKKLIETDVGGDGIDLSGSIFHSIKWGRIVLDEAHRIKGRDTSTSRAAFALTGDYRWCLTGTPLQNRVGDVYSLFRFLRMAPYARYYCLTDGCSCSSFSHPFSGKSLRQCIFCGHGPLQHYAYFNRHILNPIIRYGYIGDGRRGMMMLTNEAFRKSMLRRTKTERADDLHLPPLVISVVKVQLVEEERNFYESLYKKSTAAFDTFVAKGTVLHNYAHIFQLLSRLRQALDHPLLVIESMNVGKVIHPKGLCGICMEGGEMENTLQLNPCRHTFHRVCLAQFIESSPGKEYHCPTCTVIVSIDLRNLCSDWADGEEDGVTFPVMPPELEDHMRNSSQKDDSKSDECISSLLDANNEESTEPMKSKRRQGIFTRIDPAKPLYGTKLNAIADYVCKVPKEDKVIVFSQFGDMLDLIQFWLQKVFIKAVKLTGALMISQRYAVLQTFLYDPTVRVILISLKAGGEGLNLQNANHVLLVDPWWNPAVEMQAAQRAHRIGQTKPVHAVRFVTENSVEERMLDLQNKKMLVFEGTVDGKISSLQQLNEEDLQFLFTK